MRRRVLVSTVATVLICGCSGLFDDDPSTPTTASTATDENTTLRAIRTSPSVSPTTRSASTPRTASPVPTPTPSPTTRRIPNQYLIEQYPGSGSETYSPISVPDEMTIFEYTYEGDGGFTVTLIGPDGEGRWEIVDTTGPVEGFWARSLLQGDYTLDVTAEGDWIIRKHLPHSYDEGDEPPVTIDGDESGGFRFLHFGGDVRAYGRHEGHGPFSVRSYTEDGDLHPDTDVFRADGPFSGEATIGYEGSTWVVVNASGQWSVSFV